MGVIMEEEQYHINTCDNRGRRDLFTSKGRFPRAAGAGEPEPEREDGTLSEETTECPAYNKVYSYGYHRRYSTDQIYM